MMSGSAADNKTHRSMTWNEPCRETFTQNALPRGVSVDEVLRQVLVDEPVLMII